MLIYNALSEEYLRVFGRLNALYPV